MRLLHTSDWHLGRQFHGASLLEEQALMVDRVVEVARGSGVDAVIIAGDLYDRAIPPGPAVELLDDALLRLRDTGALVVAISGNHDSSARVGYGERLMSRAGVTVRSDVGRAAEPVLIPATDGSDAVAVYLVPYLDPVITDVTHQADQDPEGDGRHRRPTHQQALDRVLRPVRRDRSRRGLTSVVVAHAFVANAAPRLDEDPVETCDSERELAAGGAGRVDPAVFAGFDLVALGHLHRQQSWSGGRIAYSGSPLRYSFSEEHHHKCVRVVDLQPGRSPSVDLVEVGVGLPLRTITGDLADLLVDPTLGHAEAARVRAVLTDAHLPHQAMAQLRARFPHAAELVHLPPERDGGPAPVRTSQDVRRRRPLDLTLEFLAEQWDEPPDRTSQAILREAVTAVLGEAP